MNNIIVTALLSLLIGTTIASDKNTKAGKDDGGYGDVYQTYEEQRNPKSRGSSRERYSSNQPVVDRYTLNKKFRDAWQSGVAERKEKKAQTRAGKSRSVDVVYT